MDDYFQTLNSDLPESPNQVKHTSNLQTKPTPVKSKLKAVNEFQNKLSDET